MTIPSTDPARQALDELLITISNFQNKHDKYPGQETLAWGAFCERLSVHQPRFSKDGPLFSPVSHKAGATRGNDGVDRVFLAVCDIDNHPPDGKGGGVADEDVLTVERFLERMPTELEVF